MEGRELDSKIGDMYKLSLHAELLADWVRAVLSNVNKCTKSPASSKREMKVVTELVHLAHFARHNIQETLVVLTTFISIPCKLLSNLQFSPNRHSLTPSTLDGHR